MAGKRATNRPSLSAEHWVHWCMNLLCAVGAGIFLIPYFRSNPESVHTFATELPDWQRQLFVFLVCAILAYTLCKLFSPRLSHLRYFFSHPPIWSAWLLGVVGLCGLDLGVGLSKNTYTASWEEWLGFGLGPVLVVFLVRSISAIGESFGKPVLKGKQTRNGTGTLDWTTLEPWLQSEAPASHDFLGNYRIAERLSGLLSDGTRSIGIVAPFGAGKSSVVKWIEELVEESNEFLLSEHSCWGFETSSASIHSMLVDAIGKVEERIDTFQVSSLPESYRQTFSAGGEWLDNISKMLFGQRDPIDQFRRLSALLDDMGVRLVYVVEDLDRNDSRSFDIQEVLAFLQQLKEFPNLSFILVGGLSASARIDYAKLCDHIEYVRTLSVHQSGLLVAALRERCISQEAFPHVHLIDADDNQWRPNRWLLLSDRDEIYPPEAIARLLNTPRALRHTLGLTYRTWRNLFGEIDFDHLLAINVLRYAAPEAFSFVLRHWHRIHDQPPDYMHRHGQLNVIRASLRREWEHVCGGADWDPRAARAIIDLILPSTPTWLDETDYGGQPRPQGVEQERYWQRALNENIAPDEVRDQIVIRDIQQWIDSPVPDAPLVTGICSKSRFSNVWEDLAYRYFSDDRERILLLCTQVLDRIRLQHGPAASSDCQGFIAIWRYANRHAGHVESNARWLEDRITEAASVSLELVNSLWHYWGAGNYTILRPEDRDRVRRHIIDVLQHTLTTAEALGEVTHPSFRYIFYQLVFDPGQHIPVLAGPAIWSWMGPVLLAGLRRGQVTTAIGVCSLVASRDGSSRREPTTADHELIRSFFGNDASQAIDAIEMLLPQVDENDRTFVTHVVQSARARLAEDHIGRIDL
ncbi:P-loop NTPase fold protein [Planctomicrobium piriforme]|uniref:KAP NTPase domain-containing protein n=1 Tax=Planctomicrobium piriforme TaxID=1576369 RepID=A0A1I3EKH9_9PLAN|nr:hypothetical protein SAMN05421753_104264 [Planctomicrobium piriforme]